MTLHQVSYYNYLTHASGLLMGLLYGLLKILKKTLFYDASAYVI